MCMCVNFVQTFSTNFDFCSFKINNFKIKYCDFLAHNIMVTSTSRWAVISMYRKWGYWGMHVFFFCLNKIVGIGHFQSIKTDVWLNFLKTTNTIRIG